MPEDGMDSEHRFAFLVHPRGFNDIYLTFPFTRFLPKWLVRKVFLLIGPMVVGKVYGLKTSDGKTAKGEIITVPMTARDMLENRELAAREVEGCIRLAEKRGARMVGLGSLTSVVVGGGVDVVGKFKTKITNGNALTVFMAYQGIRAVCEKKGIDMKTAQFAIVGASGSTGSGISKMLIRDGGARSELIMIGRTPSHLESLSNEMQEFFPDAKVKITNDMTETIHADVVIVATSAEGAILKAENLKKNAVVYDVTQPQNVTRSIMDGRPDLLVVDGAITKLPEGVGYTVNMGLVKGESFSCMAETMLLGLEKYPEDFCIGRVTMEKIDTISILAESYGFKPAPLRSWGKII
jgi:predicted amino acid dehydrogenase